jgi:alginate O-acetyltransferase complex protein AlgI
VKLFSGIFPVNTISMLFNSFGFLFFFVIVTLAFFIFPHKYRWFILLAASCYFYMVFVPVYILILAGTILIDYFAGILIENAGERQKRIYLTASLIGNIGVLAVFKYYNFFIENVNAALHASGTNTAFPFLNILLPIGLSFHTFQAMSYTIEVYKGRQKAERHLGIYALYVMFYPQLVAGPIERPQNIIYQFYEVKEPRYDDIMIGLSQMIRGFFKKVVVADLLATYVDNIYNNYTHNTGFTLVFATWLFLFQIYCDFSGYTDIAIGAARVMGFTLVTNFALPLFSKTMSELWKRWHISLSTWFRDYLYNPIVIAKRDWGKWAVVYASIITFLVSGLWHGASWNFVFWGLLQGIFLSLEVIFNIRTKYFNSSFLRKCAGVFITFNIYSFTLIFFRSHTFSQAINIIEGIFAIKGFCNLKINDGLLFVTMLIPLCILLSCEYFLYRKKTITQVFESNRKTLFIVNLLFVLFIIVLGVSNGSQFIYFQF